MAAFLRLPINGNTLATFQYSGGLNRAPGGLVEFDPRGSTVMTSSAAVPGTDPNIRPYSLAVVEKLNRVVTGSADMLVAQVSHVVQLWRLSDLMLLKTMVLPKGPDAAELVITGYGAMDTQALLATINRQTGNLTLDPQAIDFTRQWPDGWNGSAIPHGAVFSKER